MNASQALIKCAERYASYNVDWSELCQRDIQEMRLIADILGDQFSDAEVRAAYHLVACGLRESNPESTHRLGFIMLIPQVIRSFQETKAPVDHSRLLPLWQTIVNGLRTEIHSNGLLCHYEQEIEFLREGLEFLRKEGFIS